MQKIILWIVSNFYFGFSFAIWIKTSKNSEEPPSLCDGCLNINSFYESLHHCFSIEENCTIELLDDVYKIDEEMENFLKA